MNCNRQNCPWLPIAWASRLPAVVVIFHWKPQKLCALNRVATGQQQSLDWQSHEMHAFDSWIRPRNRNPIFLPTTMPTEYITAAWQQLTTASWKLKRSDHDLVEATNPGRHTTTMRARRIHSLACYAQVRIKTNSYIPQSERDDLQLNWLANPIWNAFIFISGNNYVPAGTSWPRQRDSISGEAFCNNMPENLNCSIWAAFIANDWIICSILLKSFHCRAYPCFLWKRFLLIEFIWAKKLAYIRICRHLHIARQAFIYKVTT